MSNGELLPPRQTLLATYQTYESCALRYLFARELNLQHIIWPEAYAEAVELVLAIETAGQALSPGARAGEVQWSSMLCVANVYASLPADLRVVVLQRVREGVPIWQVPELGAGAGCDRRVFSDPAYDPVPPCVSYKAQHGLLTFVGMLSWLLGAAGVLNALSDD